MIDLSIIIVNYNAKLRLSECLQSIRRTINSIQYEVFVVDNNSSEQIDEMATKEFPEVNLILNHSNEGFAKANNKAIKKSAGRYILLLNNDTVLIPGAINTLFSVMERSQDIGIIGPKIITENKTLQESFFKKPDLFTEFMQKNFYNRIIANKDSFLGKRLHLKYQKEQEVEWLTGACWMVRRKAIREAGLFDENFFMYFEDADLCLRIRRKGWKIIYSPLAAITHYGGISRKTNEIKAAREYRLSQLYFYTKYHNKFKFYLLKSYLFFKYSYQAISCILIFFSGKTSSMELKKKFSASKEIISLIIKYEGAPRSIFSRPLKVSDGRRPTPAAEGRKPAAPKDGIQKHC